MLLHGTPYTSLWYDAPSDAVFYIDQTCLPWDLVILEMKTFEDGVRAIREMEVRGAPLIGVAAAFAMYVGVRNFIVKAVEQKENPDVRSAIHRMAAQLIATRPTAVNLAYAVDQMCGAAETTRADEGRLRGAPTGTNHTSPSLSSASRVSHHELSPSLVTRHSSLLETALRIRESELNFARRIGENGLLLIESIAAKNPGAPVNILTHCNAGWLATVDYGTALAPIYAAHNKGIPVHVWVDETRPRNQGAKLTAFELSGHGVPNTLIVDNAGGHLMQQGMVDMVIVGADRITANGDVVNKIGTYLKALAAFDNGIPFYVAAPSSTFDQNTPTGKNVPIEERPEEEVLLLNGREPIAPAGTRVHNPGFDVTPARLITAVITEKD